MSEELLTKSKIADALGTNPMRVSRFIERAKINVAKKEGKRELYKLTQFNTLKNELKSSEAKSDKAKQASSKDELILTLKKQLLMQKEQYEQLIKSKDETISSLQESYDDLKNQLSVKDNQISTLTQLADQAQKLNLVDKAPKRLESDVEMKRESSNSSNNEADNVKKHWWNNLF